MVKKSKWHVLFITSAIADIIVFKIIVTLPAKTNYCVACRNTETAERKRGTPTLSTLQHSLSTMPNPENYRECQIAQNPSEIKIRITLHVFSQLFHQNEVIMTSDQNLSSTASWNPSHQIPRIGSQPFDRSSLHTVYPFHLSHAFRNKRQGTGIDQ